MTHPSITRDSVPSLPFVDVTKNQGSELQGELVEDDGNNSGGSLLVRSYVGGKVKCGELVLFRFDDDLMVNQPLVLSVVGKVNSKTWGRRDGVIDRATWRIVFRGSVETVEPLLPSNPSTVVFLGWRAVNRASHPSCTRAVAMGGSAGGG